MTKKREVEIRVPSGGSSDQRLWVSLDSEALGLVVAMR